ncbi:MAG TPA: hypothetical protein VG013_22160 [Gemmataceae bacterium]|jgi:hypothetical protein|nr:hypothetical protein [Gemmataceae bacterium]
MTVFADTFALIAWLNPRDEAHAVVAAYLDGFTGQQRRRLPGRRRGARLTDQMAVE